MTVTTDQDVGAKLAEEPLLLTCKQVAKLIQVSPRSVWGWASSGKIPPPITVGWRAKRWFRDDVLRWLQEKKREQQRRTAG